MPRDGSGVYTQPFPDVVAGTTIESAKYNGNVNDVEQDLNTPRPIVAGGTGANNAHDGRVALGAEASGQAVANYDMHPWENGSFVSSPGATAAPEATASYSGIVYALDTNNITIEARNVSTGVVYVRRKTAGTWGAWVQQITSQADTDARYVNVAGDTMTGPLTITGVNTGIGLDKTGGTGNNVISGRQDAKDRWLIELGTANAANFTINRYNDAGTWQASSLQIDRATGRVTVENATPTGANEVSTKSYADTKVTKTGDTMTGPLSFTGASTGLNFNSTAADGGNLLFATKNSVARWRMDFGSGDAEAGSNAGSSFFLHNYSDAGAFLSTPLAIDRRGVTTLIGQFKMRHASSGVSGLFCTLSMGFMGAGTQYGIVLQPMADGTYPIVFNNSGAVQVGTIGSSTTNTSYNTASGAELKEDLKSFDAGNIIDQTNVYDFKWKSTGERSYGVIAQQANEVYPTAVTHMAKNEKVGHDEWWGVDYSKYVPVILQELKALRARVRELEGKPGIDEKPQ